MVSQFLNLSEIFDPFYITFVIVIAIIIIVGILFLIFILKFFFGGSKEEIVSSESNPYRAKPKTSKIASDSENKYATKPKPTICHYCGTKVEKNQKICSQCGANLD